MKTEFTRGDIKVIYNSKDWNIKQSRLKSITHIFLSVIITLVIIIVGAGIPTKLEQSGVPFAICLACMVVIILVTLILVTWYFAERAYKKCIPAYQTIDWLYRTRNIEAGYFKGKLQFEMQFSNGNITRNLSYVIHDIKNEHIVDESALKDNQKQINVEFDFTNRDKTMVKVSNKELS